MPEHANGACMLEIIERGRGEGRVQILESCSVLC